MTKKRQGRKLQKKVDTEAQKGGRPFFECSGSRWGAVRKCRLNGRMSGRSLSTQLAAAVWSVRIGIVAESFDVAGRSVWGANSQCFLYEKVAPARLSSWLMPLLIRTAGAVRRAGYRSTITANVHDMRLSGLSRARQSLCIVTCCAARRPLTSECIAKSVGLRA